MTQPKPAMDWHDVVAHLHRSGMTLTELAKRNDMDPSIFRQVKNRTNFKAQKVIADFVGQKPESIWPDRYNKGKSRILDTNKFPPVASQKADASTDTRRAA